MGELNTLTGPREVYSTRLGLTEDYAAKLAQALAAHLEQIFGASFFVEARPRNEQIGSREFSIIVRRPELLRLEVVERLAEAFSAGFRAGWIGAGGNVNEIAVSAIRTASKP